MLPRQMPDQRWIANAAPPSPPSVFLVLLEEAAGRAMAESLSLLAPAGAVRTLLPPLTGAAFLADASKGGAVVDRWWEDARPGPCRPVVVVAHEENLPGTLRGLDADFVVAVPDAATGARYTDLPNARAVVAADPSRLAQVALHEHVTPACARVRPLDPFDLLSRAGALTGPVVPVKRSRRRLARPRAALHAARED